MKGKTYLRGITAAVLICAMLFAFMPSAFAADDGFVLTELPEAQNLIDPIPALVIKVSYDPNNNGVNDYDPENSTRLYDDKTSEYYGEQWCYSSDKYWADMMFSDDPGSLKTYYKEVSCGRFYFYPAEETYASEERQGVINDGIVNVVIPYKHPMADTGSILEVNDKANEAALRAAAEYVDFSKFDKNGDGKLSPDELTIIFISGGVESSHSISRINDKLVFGAWGRESIDNDPFNIDGVDVGEVYVLMGEYYTATQPLTIGIVLHELGHVLGAPDIYDTGEGGGGWMYAGDLSSMSYGQHLAYDGEPRGSSSSYMDPFNAIYCGLMASTEVTTGGDYTLYSRSSKKGEYNILRINTPNPKEYYLIENRYHNSGDTKFDAIDAEDMGVMIWHIDENILSEFWYNSNTYGMGHDPAIVPIGTTSLGARYQCGFRYTEGAPEDSYIFESGAKRYGFPFSGKKYTSLTPEQAEGFNLKITVKSGLSCEMTVSVSGVAEIAPEFEVSAESLQADSLTFGGRITALHGGDVSSIKLILSENENITEETGTVKTVSPNKDGTFSVSFDGLSPDTEYFCRAIVSGKNGESEQTINARTLQKPVTTTTTVVETTTTTTTVTTEPDATTTPSATTDGGKSGCGSAIGAGASFAVIGAVGLALWIGRKKKE